MKVDKEIWRNSDRSIKHFPYRLMKNSAQLSTMFIFKTHAFYKI